MEEAHGRGFIHRDLKPSNVMVNRRGELVIMDFGLARPVDVGDARLTKSGVLLGTPRYMAPEQVEGDPSAIGPACDIYSLGVILYELLAGRRPFVGSVAVVLGQKLVRPPEPPSTFRPDLDPGLEAICLKALAIKPADRYATMADFAVALGDYLVGREAKIDDERVGNNPGDRHLKSSRGAVRRPAGWPSSPPSVSPRFSSRSSFT